MLVTPRERGLGPEERRQAERAIRRHRAEPGVVRVASVPVRGTPDRYGDEFPGLPRNRLAFRTLTEEEQATNSTDGRVLASGDTNAQRAVDTPHIKDNANTNRTLATDAVDGRVLKNSEVEGRHIKGRLGPGAVPTLGDMDGSVPPGKLPALNGLNGKLNSSEKIDWRARSVPKGALVGIDWGKVDGKPKLVGPAALDALEARMRKWSNARFAVKGHRHTA